MIYEQLKKLEEMRYIIVKQLLEDIEKYPNKQEQLEKIFITETQKIDDKIRELRLLMMRKGA